VRAAGFIIPKRRRPTRKGKECMCICKTFQPTVVKKEHKREREEMAKKKGKRASERESTDLSDPENVFRETTTRAPGNMKKNRLDEGIQAGIWGRIISRDPRGKLCPT